jgi:superfamily II DNA or RNA helicase
MLMEKQKFFVAILSYIKPIGYVILPYSCFRENDAFITVHERLTALNINNYPEIGTAETEICNLGESYSNKALIKQFSKTKQTPKEFFAHLDKKFLDEMIRPFIERKLAKIIDLLLEHNISFYNGNDNTNLYPGDELFIEKESPTATLKFVRTAEGTQYKLRAFHADGEIVLNNFSHKVLVNEPCWFVTGNKVLRFDENISGKLLSPFRNKEFVAIPKRMEHQYFSTFIRKIANRCQIEAEGFQVNDLMLEPEAILSLEMGWQGRIVLVLSFKYGDKVLLANHPQTTFTTLLADENGFVFNRFKRNTAWEAAQIAFLKSRGLKQVEATFLLNTNEGTIYKGYQMVEWLTTNRSDLALRLFSIKQPENIKYLLEVPVLTLVTQTGMDWFDLYGTVILKDLEIPFIKFKYHIINNIKEYELPTGEIVVLPDEWFSRFQDLMINATQHNNAFRIRKHHFNLLTEIQIPEIEKLVGSLTTPQAVDLPALENVSLREYQLGGFYWLHSLRQNGFGGILADDMGLGKTLQTIALLASLYPKRELPPTDFTPAKNSNATTFQLDLFAEEVTNPLPITQSTPQATQDRFPTSLIVLPASLIHNWLNEFARFAPWLGIYTHVGLGRTASISAIKQHDIVLTTYGTMRNDIEMLLPFTFGYIILDESQTIKNPTSKATQAVFRLNSQHRLVLTGTPIQNSLSDIWSQFNFLNPEILGTHTHFMKMYAIPLAKNHEDRAADRLKNLINPFILRRTKEEVAPELPPITESVVYCGMTEAQQSHYETEKSKVRNLIIENFKLDDRKATSVLVLRALTILRQLANHPRMLENGSEAGSGKFLEVTEKLETALSGNHKVLIFSSFVKHLKLIEEFCAKKAIKYALLTGSTTKREQVINSFKNKKEIQLFLISLKTGGVGLNLTEADYVFILDPWWNPAAEMQALNRAHRIGQDKNVFVYRFISSETVEEKIMVLQQTKKDLANLFVPSDSSIAGMTKEEILGVFE